MKKIQYYILALVAAMTFTMSSCSDKYMEELNTDPTKTNSIDPNAQLTTAVLQTYGDLGMMETYRSYLFAFTQHFMGCWNTTNYGGHHNPDNNEMMRIWTSLYPNAIKNLTDGISRTTDDESSANINAVLRIYRAYMISLITDIYGDAPCKEAGLGYIDSKFTPVFDKQEDIYTYIFEELKAAVDQLNPAGDNVTGDLIYNGNIDSWKRFANSLRLRYAMRVSNVNPDLAQAQFEDALNSDGGVFSSAADDATIKYMDVAFSFGQDAYSDYRGNALSQLWFGNDPANNPTYICSTFYSQMQETGDPRMLRICRYYWDGYMSMTAPTDRVDLTDEIMSKGVKVNPVVPGAYWWEPWPEGYTSDLIAEIAKRDPSVNPYLEKETRPKLANNFLKGDNPGIVITFAEVNFLLAEAIVKGWNVGGNAEDFYKNGVREAMNVLADKYGCSYVSDDEFNAYIANNGIGHSQIENIKNINTQAWILHFTNPVEAWSNVRRSGFPVLNSPDYYGYGSVLVDGKEIPRRLCYPVLESSYNKKSYDEAVARMGGNDFHKRVWWDINK